VLDQLRDRAVNYDDAQAPPHVTTGWHEDLRTVELGREEPGEPVPGGLVETAGRLVNSYQFSDPAIVRAAFRTDGDLVGRDMLLEGRFLFLRFLLGVRITDRHDELRDGAAGPQRVIGWSYRTLRGHLEQGRLTYEIVKELTTGRVVFRIAAYSRRAPIANPVLRLGFGLFGRATQLRFYRAALRRLAAQVRSTPTLPQPGPDGVVRAPAGAGPGRFEGVVVRFTHPGR
jgi:uncharacterized protein (UPF0548 family)